jgi:plastocyanin
VPRHVLLGMLKFHSSGRSRPTRLRITIGAVLIGLSACGSDSSDSSDATVAESSSSTETAQISIVDFNFSNPITVGTGGTVTVTNNDGVDHTWTSDDGAFDSGVLASGATFEFTFTEAGEFNYHCEIHPSMTSSVAVEG